MMTRAMIQRLKQFSVVLQHSSGQRRAGVAAVQRGLATGDSTTSAPAPGAKDGARGAEGEGGVEGEAAARRAALLKRYGDRTPTSGPIAVKSKAAGEGGGFDVEKKVAEETNHNEIWGDYVRYMEHQRKKGWKT